jgi:superfamily II RNA helicase
VENALLSRLPATPEEANPDLILDRFLDFVRAKKLELYPAQEEAILELFSGKNVILNTPTGSGKSLVATALHFEALANHRRSIYTCPIKALVNEKFLSLCKEFGPDQVGMITGDASVNPSAPIICCTAEILAIDALRYGSETPISDVIMDEFHYYSDRDRGVAWQIPLLTLSQTRFLLMSATLGDTTFFESELTRLNGRETVTIRSADRPVPLDFKYVEIPLHETVAKLVQEGKSPVYLVCFTQREAAEEAQNLLSVDFCTKEEKKAISEALENTRFSSPYGKEIQKLLKHGVGLHHAGLLPKYRVLVERLAQKGLLKIICGTDTLGVGVNIPIRTVLFTQLCKFDGEKSSLLTVRDFQQISGRAGRKGFDNQGYVVAQAPAHLVENLRLEQKAGGDPKKLRKLVKRKPPEKGYVAWNQETFNRLISSQPEPLTSRFQVTHAMLLHVLSRQNENGGKAMQKLIRKSHESPASKRQHRKKAFQLFRSLVERKIIELQPLRLNVDLQEDFSLNHALSLYLIDTLRLLDPSDPEYALDLLTLVESILENPDLILRKQLDRIKTEKMDELKQSGMEYDERIEELEKLEYPKPNRDFIYDTFNEFASVHPWVGQENIRPKSIAREMYENFQSFSEYIRDYQLQRSEGILLRYLSDVYKTLSQTVPDTAKNEEVYSIEAYLRTLLRQVDSSLLDEWERMRNPQWVSRELNEQETGSPSATLTTDITRNEKAFSILIRNEIFRFIRSIANDDYEAALTVIEPSLNENGDLWNAERLKSVLESYYSAEHSRICTDTKARNPKNTHFEKNAQEWKVHQILADPEEHNDWSVQFLVDIHASREAQKPVLKLVDLGQL